MCGIAGILSKKNIAFSHLKKMTDALVIDNYLKYAHSSPGDMPDPFNKMPSLCYLAVQKQRNALCHVPDQLKTTEFGNGWAVYSK